MTKNPWFKFYPADWLSDRKVALMSPAEKGVYIDLLCLTWVEGAIPDDAAQLAKLLRLTRRTFEPIWKHVRALFEESSPGFLTNKRLEKERAGANSRHERAIKGANARWDDDEQASSKQSEIDATQKEKEKQREKEKAPPPADAGRQPLLEIQDPPKTKTKKVDDPLRQDIIEALEHFKKRWVQRMQPDDGKPARVLEADWKQLGSVVREHGKEAAIGFIDRYLEDPEPFLVENVYALRHLPGKVDKYRTKGPRSTPAARRAPTTTDVLAERDRVEREHRAKVRAEFEAQGYRYVDREDGTVEIYDPDGHLLDARGRPVKS